MNTDPSEAAAWHAPARLSRLLSATPLMLAYLDDDLVVRMASRAWAEWFGVEADAAVGTPYLELVGEPAATRHRAYLDLARRGTETGFDDERRNALGASRWCRVHVAPDVDADGRGGVLVAMLETTAERSRDEVIVRQREQLFTRFRDQQRNEQVHAELEKTRTLLDWRTSMLTERNEMLHLLSHEIRQPLNNASAAMQATMTAIEDLHLPTTTAASTALARAEGVLNQVIGTLDNTLAAGTILAIGEGTRELSDTDLPTLVSLVLADIAADLRPRITVQRVTGTRTVHLHPTLMRLVLRNLLSNALAYSPVDAPVVLRITESEEPLALIIEVRDEGSGIPDELRPRLFEKGARGSNSRMRQGAGLGLFIVRAVTRIHRGDVEALPNTPSGTIMRLTLPQGLAD